MVMSLRWARLLAGVLVFVFVFSGFVSAKPQADASGLQKTISKVSLSGIPISGYATDEVIYVNGQRVHAIVYYPGLEDMKIEALYRFAKKNGVDMNAFFRYLSEYEWEHGPVTFDEVRSILIKFANEQGIDLVRVAKREGVDLDFKDIIRRVTKENLKPRVVDIIGKLSVASSSTSTSDCGNNPDFIYDYYGNTITDATCDPATFYFDHGSFAGIYASAKVGTLWYIFTWSTYRTPSEVKDWIINYLKNEKGVAPNEVELVHIKYFIQGYASWMKRYSTTVYFDNAPVQDCILFELWSEATYYPSTNTWVKYGYPDYNLGGLFVIWGQEIKTLAGFAMKDYTPYPTVSYRIVGSGITYVNLTLYSTIWHQQRLEGVGDWW